MSSSVLFKRVSHAGADPRTVERFDGVLDLAGTQLAALRRTLAPGGRMVTVALSGPAIRAIALPSVHGSRRIRTFSASSAAPELSTLTRGFDAESTRLVVASTRPLAEIADAHCVFKAGGALGKHVLPVTRRQLSVPVPW